MPEGDTVFRAVRTLHHALSGREIVTCDFRVPQLATSDLTGQTVTEVVARGKHMLTRTDAGLTLHTHFKMDGVWRVYETGKPWARGSNEAIRLVIGNSRYVAVGYRMPVVELVRTSEEDTIVGHLGPDILGPDWNLDEALRRISAEPGRSIGDALLDQRNIAGIGNLYKNESLYLCGVHPTERVARVDVEKVVKVARRLMKANIEHWEQSTTGARSKAERHWVFERPGSPCRRCGTLVEVALNGDGTRPPRYDYWCPSCQPKGEDRLREG